MTVILFLNHDEQLSAVASDKDLDLHVVNQGEPAYELVEDRKYGDEPVIIVSGETVGKVMELLEKTPRIEDHTETFLKEQLNDHLETHCIELTEEQYRSALNGVRFWLNHTISESIADAVHTSIFSQREIKASTPGEARTSLDLYEELMEIFEAVKPDDVDPDEVEDMSAIEDMNEPKTASDFSEAIKLLRHFIYEWLPDDEEERAQYISILEEAKEYE